MAYSNYTTTMQNKNNSCDFQVILKRDLFHNAGLFSTSGPSPKLSLHCDRASMKWKSYYNLYCYISRKKMSRYLKPIFISPFQKF